MKVNLNTSNNSNWKKTTIYIEDTERLFLFQLQGSHSMYISLHLLLATRNLLALSFEITFLLIETTFKMHSRILVLYLVCVSNCSEKSIVAIKMCCIFIQRSFHRNWPNWAHHRKGSIVHATPNHMFNWIMCNSNYFLIERNGAFSW